MLQYARLFTMPYQEQARVENVRYFKAYAEELREKFREGFLSEFTHLRQPQIVVWRNQLLISAEASKVW